MQDSSQSPDLQETLNRGRAALKDSRTDEALQLFSTAVARAPNDYTARTGMGAALMHLGRPGEAVEHFKKAMAVRPDSTQPMLNLGRAYHAAGEYFVAENLFRQVLQRDPSNAAAQSALDAIARDKAQGHPAAHATRPPVGPSPIDRKTEAEALLAGGAHSAQLRAAGARSMKVPLIGGAVLIAILVVELVVQVGGRLATASKGWDHYVSPNKEFELDVPKGWMAKVGMVDTAFEWEGVTEAFGPTGVLPPMVRYVVTAVPVTDEVTLACCSNFAGHLNTRGDVITTLRPDSYECPRYPIASQQDAELGGVPAVEFILCDGDAGSKQARRVYHVMTIHKGVLYSLHYEGTGRDYDKFIERIHQSVASFKFAGWAATGMAGQGG